MPSQAVLLLVLAALSFAAALAPGAGRRRRPREGEEEPRSRQEERAARRAAAAAARGDDARQSPPWRPWRTRRTADEPAPGGGSAPRRPGEGAHGGSVPPPGGARPARERNEGHGPGRSRGAASLDGERQQNGGGSPRGPSARDARGPDPQSQSPAQQAFAAGRQAGRRAPAGAAADMRESPTLLRLLDESVGAGVRRYQDGGLEQRESQARTHWATWLARSREARADVDRTTERDQQATAARAAGPVPRFGFLSAPVVVVVVSLLLWAVDTDIFLDMLLPLGYTPARTLQMSLAFGAAVVVLGHVTALAVEHGVVTPHENLSWQRVAQAAAVILTLGTLVFVFSVAHSRGVNSRVATAVEQRALQAEAPQQLVSAGTPTRPVPSAGIAPGVAAATVPAPAAPVSPYLIVPVTPSGATGTGGAASPFLIVPAPAGTGVTGAAGSAGATGAVGPSVPVAAAATGPAGSTTASPSNSPAQTAEPAATAADAETAALAATPEYSLGFFTVYQMLAFGLALFFGLLFGHDREAWRLVRRQRRAHRAPRAAERRSVVMERRALGAQQEMREVQAEVHRQGEAVVRDARTLLLRAEEGTQSEGAGRALVPPAPELGDVIARFWAGSVVEIADPLEGVERAQTDGWYPGPDPQPTPQHQGASHEHSHSHEHAEEPQPAADHGRGEARTAEETPRHDDPREADGRGGGGDGREPASAGSPPRYERPVGAHAQGLEPHEARHDPASRPAAQDALPPRERSAEHDVADGGASTTEQPVSSPPVASTPETVIAIGREWVEESTRSSQGTAHDAPAETPFRAAGEASTASVSSLRTGELLEHESALQQAEQNR